MPLELGEEIIQTQGSAEEEAPGGRLKGNFRGWIDVLKIMT